MRTTYLPITITTLLLSTSLPFSHQHHPAFLSLLVPYLDGNDVLVLVMIMAANEDDLYGDLEDAVATPVPPNKKSTNTMSGEPSRSTMMPEPEIQLLLEQLKQIKAENDLLKRNMGILYRTAKSELERKDRAIFQLQNELDSLRR